MIQEFERLEKLNQAFAEAYRDFSQKDQTARATISIVSRRISGAKKETDDGIAECKTIIADVTRSTAAQTAAAIRLEALLGRSFPVTPEEMRVMSEAVEAADTAYTVAMRARREYGDAHEKARLKLKEMRDRIFGNVPSAMNLTHTHQTLHDYFHAVQEGK